MHVFAVALFLESHYSRSAPAPGYVERPPMSHHDDILRFIFRDSQVDADVAASLSEAQSLERVTKQKAPLVKALKALGIETENMTVDELGCKLLIKDQDAYRTALTAIDSVEAMNSLADAGWVAGIAGDVADTTELPDYTINFLCLDVAEPSELTKAVSVGDLNKEVKSGSDVEPNPVAEDVGDDHQLRIAKQTLKMSDSGAKIMGGMTKDEARTFLKSRGYSPQKIANLENPGWSQEVVVTRTKPSDVIVGKPANESAEADGLLEDADAGAPLTDEERSIAPVLAAAEKIQTVDDVKRFFKALVDAGINFHPDTPFEDYEDRDHKRTFTDDEAALLNRAMEQVFSLPDIDPYEVGLEILRPAVDGLGEDASDAVDKLISKTEWQASDTTDAKHLGPLEIEGAPNEFEILELPDRLVFGGPTNNTFLESGYLLKEDGESTDEALQELVAELEVYYRDGPSYVSRIVVNDRM